MKRGGVGGANTLTGAKFEFDKDLAKFIANLKDYQVIENDSGQKVVNFASSKNA